MALAVHGALWTWAWRSHGETQRQSVAGVQGRRARETTVDLTVPPPPPDRKVQLIEPIRKPASPPQVHTASRPQALPSAPPPPPAQAGAILAHETSEPVDLTNDAFVTGNAQAFAGGITGAKGTNTVPGSAGEVPEGSPSAARIEAPDRSRAVSLEGANWSCPWPTQADAEQLHEQTVVIRVVVAADGHAESAHVVADPGRGFGPSATSCALRTRFTPAQDRNGAPIRARSPPIRVRFTR
jgi:protein TonB